MKLSAIAAMFVPDSIWEVEYTNPHPRQLERARRRVAIRRTGEIVWDTGFLDPLHTPLPKASEVVAAADGMLSMRYSQHTDAFVFRRVDDPARAAAIREELRTRRHTAEQAAAAEKEEKARKQAENAAKELAGIHARISEGQSVTPRQLIDACTSLGIDIPIQTKGALLRKTLSVSPESFSHYKGKAPRFTHQHHPSNYYCRARDAIKGLVTPGREEEEDESGLTPEELDHLFHGTPAPSKEVPAANIITPRAAAVARITPADLARKELLKRIALASLRPCPRIVETSVYVVTRTGQWVSMGGAAPMEPYTVEHAGYVYYDPRSNTTFGKRFPTPEAARWSHHFRQLRSAVIFLRQLRAMSPAVVEEQAAYWLKQEPAAPAPAPAPAAIPFPTPAKPDLTRLIAAFA